MLRSRLCLLPKVNKSFRNLNLSRQITTLSAEKITQLLRRNEVILQKDLLPSCVKSVECNQLASNSPIEDRLRVSSIRLPGLDEPTLILGVFDGHGGGTTADLISRRLFKYIALSLYPEIEKLKISKPADLDNLLVDLHNSPQPRPTPDLGSHELGLLTNFVEKLPSTSNGSSDDIASNLKASFKSCDDDLSDEIQMYLTNPRSSPQALHYYLSAAVSGCCAIVMVVHQGRGYIVSSGDCRAVLGVREEVSSDNPRGRPKFGAIELNEEHNCDNVSEVRRLTASHPKSEQNTMIKHNRLLGHLMPFRAFGDFNYKWPVDVINACGITRAFGSGVIPSNYLTPPYLIVEPDVKQIEIDNGQNGSNYLVMASDGLWEMFESSRDVIETVADHANRSSQDLDHTLECDENCATHILRSALCYGLQQDVGMNPQELRRLHHIRLESTLTLPQTVVRNFRDDISIIMMQL